MIKHIAAFTLAFIFVLIVIFGGFLLTLYLLFNTNNLDGVMEILEKFT